MARRPVDLTVAAIVFSGRPRRRLDGLAVGLMAVVGFWAIAGLAGIRPFVFEVPAEVARWVTVATFL